MKAYDWDRLAARYQDEVFDIFSRDRRKVIRRWLQARGMLQGRKDALDVGCGIGSFVRKYGRHFGEKTGVDYSRLMLRVAARRCRSIPHCHWLQADIQRLPRSLYDSADLVVCSNVITFISMAACSRAVRTIIRCARLGGSLLIIVPSLECHDTSIALLTGRSPPRRIASSAIVRRDDRLQRFFKAEGVRRLATDAGIRSICVQKVWYSWIDEGITRPPEGAKPPWCWLLTGRR